MRLIPVDHDPFEPGHYAEGGAAQGDEYGPGEENLASADKEMQLNPQEKALYRRHLSNLWGPGGVDNPDGSRSTLYQGTFQNGSKFYTLPTVWDGQILPPHEAFKRAYAEGLDKFPSYKTGQEAEDRYGKLHKFLEMDTADYFAHRPRRAGGGDAGMPSTYGYNLPEEDKGFGYGDIGHAEEETGNRAIRSMYDPQEAASKIDRAGLRRDWDAEVAGEPGRLARGAEGLKDFTKSVVAPPVWAAEHLPENIRALTASIKEGDLRESAKNIARTAFEGTPVIGPMAGAGTMVGWKAARNLARQGRPALLEAMQIAEKMQGLNKSDAEIWAATTKYLKDKEPNIIGVEPLADRQLAAELSDHLAHPGAVSPYGQTQNLFQHIHHPELEEAYRGIHDFGLKNLTAEYGPATPDLKGRFEHARGSPSDLGYTPAQLRVQGPTAAEAMGVVGHETAHEYQHVEGHPRGGDAREFLNDAATKKLAETYFKDAKLDKRFQGISDATLWEASLNEASKARYRNLAGENQAEANRHRWFWDPEQRRSTPPSSNEPTPRSEQIFKYGDDPQNITAPGRGQNMAEVPAKTDTLTGLEKLASMANTEKGVKEELDKARTALDAAGVPQKDRAYQNVLAAEMLAQDIRGAARKAGVQSGVAPDPGDLGWPHDFAFSVARADNMMSVPRNALLAFDRLPEIREQYPELANRLELLAKQAQHFSAEHGLYAHNYLREFNEIAQGDGGIYRSNFERSFRDLSRDKTVPLDQLQEIARGYTGKFDRGIPMPEDREALLNSIKQEFDRREASFAAHGGFTEPARPIREEMAEWPRPNAAERPSHRELSREDQEAVDNFKRSYLAKTSMNEPVPLSIKEMIKKDFDAGMNSFQIGERYGVSPHWARKAKSMGALDREAGSLRPKPEVKLSDEEQAAIEAFRNRSEVKRTPQEIKDLIARHSDAGLGLSEIGRRFGLSPSQVWRLQNDYGGIFRDYPVSRYIRPDEKAKVAAYLLKNEHYDPGDVASKFGVDPGHVYRIEHELVHNNGRLREPGPQAAMKRYLREAGPSPENGKITMPSDPNRYQYAEGGEVDGPPSSHPHARRMEGKWMVPDPAAPGKLRAVH